MNILMKGGGGSAPAAAVQVVRNGSDTFLEGKNWIWGQVGCGGVKERGVKVLIGLSPWKDGTAIS